jgi:hypothetical protein
MRMSGRFSGQDYEAIERRIAQQDRNVKPKLGPKRNALNNAESIGSGNSCWHLHGPSDHGEAETPPDQAELQALQRVASLAAACGPRLCL